MVDDDDDERARSLPFFRGIYSSSVKHPLSAQQLSNPLPSRTEEKSAGEPIGLPFTAHRANCVNDGLILGRWKWDKM